LILQRLLVCEHSSRKFNSLIERLLVVSLRGECSSQ
jgi:hypothetical protein